MYRVEPQSPPSYGPPVFITCANDDPLKIANKSVQIYLDWINVGFSADLHMYSKGGHGFGTNKQNLPVDSWLNTMIDWIKYLK